MGAFSRLALSLVVIAAVPFSGCAEGEHSRSVGGQYARQADSLRNLVDSLRETNSRDRERHRHPINDNDLTFLSQRVQDPIGRLITSLQSRSDLIPFQNPLPESQFGFHSPKLIYVMDGHHVFAYADDGYNQRAVLLEYEIPDTTIKWKVLWASLHP